jgi:stearoyl-CoA desaturase (delta-9 desaturase)
MHRLHHANTDLKGDPHSPANDPNLFAMMWSTRNNYFSIYKGRTDVPEKFTKDLPDWKTFDRIFHNYIFRMLWIAAYVAFYMVFATAWWQYLLLPVTILIGSFQGAAVNYWAHWLGYVNFKQSNTSKNILPVDPIFWGESFHNNHHQFPGRPNNAHRWFEVDMGYLAMKAMDFLGIIKLRKVGIA